MVPRASSPVTKTSEWGTSQTFDVEIAARTDVGCVRTLNEDSVHCVRPSSEALRRTHGSLAIVADGMGGHAAGEVASRMAVDAVSEAYYSSEGSPRDGLVGAFREANARIFAAAQQARHLSGMGTTCCALAVCQNMAYSANVGDSRLYMVRGGQIYLMTADDSAVQEMVARGLLTSAEARHHADRNVILRAMGTHDTVAVAAWVQPLPVREGDVFVLCSDGLHDEVEDEEIRDLVLQQSAEGAAAELVALARTRGGSDNISVVVVRLRRVSEAPGDETRPMDDITTRTEVAS